MPFEKNVSVRLMKLYCARFLILPVYAGVSFDEEGMNLIFMYCSDKKVNEAVDDALMYYSLIV